eukprot:CAMPEP_0170611540 /NCGR_PEP_ID=MMETSP0224-20130122/23241_1 /TAXON_ID=285029 /ORGANISM="Togula jolla, Strain CCCM 725" /LENGTH=87 /DNA_ID=CAMNT_0010936977 /DNA_START=156 /DNA_END=419 /DNA_ORIENTATION=-
MTTRHPEDGQQLDPLPQSRQQLARLRRTSRSAATALVQLRGHQHIQVSPSLRRAEQRPAVAVVLGRQGHHHDRRVLQRGHSCHVLRG